MRVRFQWSDWSAGGKIPNDQLRDVEKQNFIWIPCDPYLPQTLHSMKRNHIIGHRVTFNYTHGPIIHENAFLVISKNAVFVRFVKQQMQKRHLVVFNFPVHWPSVFVFFSRWVMGWRLRLRTCYIGHLKYPLVGKRVKKKKKSIEVFFSFLLK